MSELLRFKSKYVLKIAEYLSNNLLDNLDAVSIEIDAVVSVGTERTMIERLNNNIARNTKRFKKRLFASHKQSKITSK